MRIKVNLTHDQIDKVVIKECLHSLSLLTDPEDDPFETCDNKADTIAAFCRVLKYYTTTDRYEKELKKLTMMHKEKRAQ